MKLHTIIAVLVLAGLICGATAHAQGISDDVIRIGFITDMSGVYSGHRRQGRSGSCLHGDRGRRRSDQRQEDRLVSADHQNKADVASARVREWFDEQKVDVIIAGTNSSTSLAMAGVAAAKKKPFMAIGRGRIDLTNAQCSPYTVHYAYDTVALARGTGSAVVKDGGKSWFFLTADYAFGHALERDTVVAGRRSRAARSRARCGRRWARRTSRPSCCRRRPPRPRSWAWPTRAATPSTPSRPPMNSA